MSHRRRDPELHERNAKVWRMRLGGATYAEIGRRFGFTAVRARDIVLRIDRRLRAIAGEEAPD